MTAARRDWALVGFVSAIVMMVVIELISWRSIAVYAARAESVDGSHQTLLGLERVLSHLRDAETGQRGFLLTRDGAHLTHYAGALQAVGERLSELKMLAADDPAGLDELERLDGLVAQKRRSLDHGIDLARERDDFEGVVAWVRTGEGRRQMEEVRTLAAGMIERESGRLARRAAESTASARTATVVTGVGNLLALAVLLGVFAYLHREIRRRAAAEAAVRHSRDEIEDLYNNAPCAYHSLDGNGVFQRINDTELAWLGYTREEVLGRMKFTDLLTPDSLVVFARNFPRFKETGRISNVDFALRRKDGSEFSVSLSATAVRDADGNYLMSRSTMFDITDRRRAEKRIAELNRDLERHAAELEQLNRELESFTYTVSHDLRSPLRAIDGFSRILEEDYGDALDAEAGRLLAVVRDNTRTMSCLIDDLLAFSRLGRKPISLATVDMGALARQALDEVMTAGTGRPQLKVGGMPEARGDPVLLKQVWLNLLSNAVKFSGRHECPEIHIGGNTDGDEHVYHVRDNGAGFDMRYYDKLFGVFQRLHRQEEFEGTGVGLAIVHRVITRHGGRVWAEGEPDRGATFYFSLPAGETVS